MAGSQSPREAEDWEDWEDEEPVTPIQPLSPQQLIKATPASPPKNNANRAQARQPENRASLARASISRLKRLKSRQRQKAQNAQAGITLVTDMSKFRRQQQAAIQLKSGVDDSTAGKFVDAAALRALEGEPTSASIGSFNWLRKKPSQAAKGKKAEQKGAAQQSPQDLSPNDRPIVIGIQLPSDDMMERVMSPLTATTLASTPTDSPMRTRGLSASQRPHNGLTPAQAQRSVWSPDTDDGVTSPDWTSRVASSVYSQSSPLDSGDIPSVPAIPSNYRAKQPTVSVVVSPVSDADTPVTLFEEDGSPVQARKSGKKADLLTSPAIVRAASQGWWDQVTTPFSERPSPVTPAVESRASGISGYNDRLSPRVDEKKGSFYPEPRTTTAEKQPASAEAVSSKCTSQNAPSPVATAAATDSVKRGVPSASCSTPSVLRPESTQTTDLPPPYSPPPSRNGAVRYRAVFPPGHPLRGQVPLSPATVSPGLQHTMTSQGAGSMTDVPLTPRPAVVAGADAVPMPDRPLGSFVPGDHFQEARGRVNRVERQRRRHEKEDAVARRVGGLWKGRGCLPENGCYGRGGREGRKKRRICLGIMAAVVAALILIISLAVTLGHHQPPAAPYSIWLNLTDFPPMPTGEFTIVGPDNTEAVTACIEPPTLWSCSLPKEEQAANAPYDASQPLFILQIQFDNSTRELWNVTGQTPPQLTTSSATQASTPSSTSGSASPPSSSPSDEGALANATTQASVDKVKKRDNTMLDTGINPNPAPPSFQEMWFLGNTTDGIVSDNKAGEPTPFYLSVLTSLNQTVGPNLLNRRELSGDQGSNGVQTFNQTNINNIAPPPVLNPDGSGATAVLLPNPSQQPIRLFDRGLPTEHYGFYSYFNKTIYVESLDTNTSASGPDGNGGSLATDANYIVTFLQMRFLVQIWTRRQNTTQLLGGPSAVGTNATQPGTFPYPVTVTVDNHGGSFNSKGTFFRPVAQPGVHINDTFAELVFMDLSAGGSLINSGFDNNPSYGGIDGGTGGCKCGYANFMGVNGA